MVNWIEKSSHIIANEIAQQSGGRSARRNSQIAALEAAVKEASELRKTLLSVSERLAGFATTARRS